MEAMAMAFHGVHDRLYGYNLQDAGTGLELINVRVRSVGHTERPTLPRLAEGGPDASGALKGSRRAWVPDREDFEEVAVYDGHALLAGNEIAGPALIERTDTTIFVTASYDATVDALGSIVLQARERDNV
jgi:N-methylhydantoinase A